MKTILKILLKGMILCSELMTNIGKGFSRLGWTVGALATKWEYNNFLKEKAKFIEKAKETLDQSA